MTLKDVLGQVVESLSSQRDELNSVDPSRASHGDEMLRRFAAARDAVPADPNADLGFAFERAAGAVATDGSYMSRAYADAFRQGARQFGGRRDELSFEDFLPLVSMLVGGLASHNTRPTGQPSALGALGPLMQMLGGGGQATAGGVGLGGLVGGLLGRPPQAGPEAVAPGGFGSDMQARALEALRYGARQTDPAGHRDAGAASTAAVVEGLLGALTGERRS